MSAAEELVLGQLPEESLEQYFDRRIADLNERIAKTEQQLVGMCWARDSFKALREEICGRE